MNIVLTLGAQYVSYLHPPPHPPKKSLTETMKSDCNYDMLGLKTSFKDYINIFISKGKACCTMTIKLRQQKVT